MRDLARYSSVELAAEAVCRLDREAMRSKPPSSFKLTHDALEPVVQPLQGLLGGMCPYPRQHRSNERDGERFAPIALDKLHTYSFPLVARAGMGYTSTLSSPNASSRP